MAEVLVHQSAAFAGYGYQDFGRVGDEPGLSGGPGFGGFQLSLKLGDAEVDVLAIFQVVGGVPYP